MTKTWQIIVTSLLLISSVVVVQALQQQQPPPLAWSSFRFAPNGVCLTPRRFVCRDDETQQQQEFTMRNVPGTGDCMFQAVALASLASLGLGGNDVLLRAISKELRDLTATVLEQPAGRLVIEGNRVVRTTTLLQSAAQQEGLSTDDYLASLRTSGMDGGLYGGGPELTVLCNVLRRPISVYELAEGDDIKEQQSILKSNDELCPIVCRGTFGGQLFEDPLRKIPHSAVTALSQSPLPGAYSWHLHILVVETPDKHACVLLPQPSFQTIHGG